MSRKRKLHDDDGTKELDSSFLIAFTKDPPTRQRRLMAGFISILPSCKGKWATPCDNSKAVDSLVKRRKCTTCLFFEWDEEAENFFLSMKRPEQEHTIKFHFNAVHDFKDTVKASLPALAFSTNFGNSETWLCIKKMLTEVFSSSHQECENMPGTPDHLFVFSRYGDYVQFRNFKVDCCPDHFWSEAIRDPLILTEVGGSFVLRPESLEGYKNFKFCLDDVMVQTKTSELALSSHPVLRYADNSGHLLHDIMFRGKQFSMLLAYHVHVLRAPTLDGYHLNLAEFFKKNSPLKEKMVLGCNYGTRKWLLRNKTKRVIRSLIYCISDLHVHRKCAKNFRRDAGGDFRENFLVKGSDVQLYNLEFVDYEETLAAENIQCLLRLIKRCLDNKNIPIDLDRELSLLARHPMEHLDVLKDHCCLMLPKMKSRLLLDMYMEFMTNHKGKAQVVGAGGGGVVGGVGVGGSTQTRNIAHVFPATFPYRSTWKKDIQNNHVLFGIATYKKVQVATSSMQSTNVRDFELGAELFKFLRNVIVHMSERAQKEGWLPFSMAETDHIIHAYFPRALPYIQSSMPSMLKKAKMEQYFPSYS